MIKVQIQKEDTSIRFQQSPTKRRASWAHLHEKTHSSMMTRSRDQQVQKKIFITVETPLLLKQKT